MLGSGLGLIDAVRLSTRNHVGLEGVLSGITRGERLSDALERLPLDIDRSAIGLIRAGEERGDLSGGLKRASYMLESKDRFQKRIVSALSYPIFVTALSFVALMVITVVLVPAFESVYSGMDIQMPLVSRLISFFGRFILNFYPAILLTLLILTVVLDRARRTERGGRLADAILLSLPVIGPIRREMMISRFFDNLCQSIKAGICIPDALVSACYAVGSPICRDRIMRSVSAVSEGVKLSLALDTGFVPRLALSLVEAGESTANLDVVFDELKCFYEETVERKIKVLSSMIEPISTLVVGCVVAIIVLSMFMPMIKLINSMPI